MKDKHIKISAKELLSLPLSGLQKLGESLGISMIGVDTVGGALTKICQNAVEFRRV